MVASDDFTIHRHLGMYGTCVDLSAWRGRDEVGDAHFTVTVDGPRWFVSAGGMDTVVETIEQAELMLRLMVSAADARRAA